MSKVLFFSGQPQQVADMFMEKSPAGFTATAASSRLSAAEKIELIQGVQYLVLHPAELANEVLREGRHLRLIQLLTAGYDKVNLQLANELGIPVANNGGANSWSVAEHAIGLVLAIYKKLIQSDESVRAGTWRKPINGFNTFEVAGKTVGVLGAGNIGSKVARRLKGFETNILYYDVCQALHLEQELGAKKAGLDELLSEADIISIHLPLLPETRGLINKEKLALMKKTAVLINTSRAEVVDEQALIVALREQRILGAGLDVFHHEPVKSDNPLLELENVILSPHTAGHGYEGWGRRFQVAWENIQTVEDGQPPRYLVKPEI